MPLPCNGPWRSQDVSERETHVFTPQGVRVAIVEGPVGVGRLIRLAPETAAALQTLLDALAASNVRTNDAVRAAILNAEVTLGRAGVR
jgi:hypothetical protein